MKTYNAAEVMDCYNRTAREYAAEFLNELDGKPFDRSLLDRFADMLPENNRVYDFGCGSGQTTAYLARRGRLRLTGLDFAREAVLLARQNFPGLEFDVDDMLASKMPPASADGILAFYAIVHFTDLEVGQVLAEWLRLLKPGGLCLFSFHAGDESEEVLDFLGVSGAKATWHLLEPDRVLELAEKAGFKQVEAVIRYPYIGVEHPSKRAYILLAKPA